MILILDNGCLYVFVYINNSRTNHHVWVNHWDLNHIPYSLSSCLRTPLCECVRVLIRVRLHMMVLSLFTFIGVVKLVRICLHMFFIHVFVCKLGFV